MGLWGDFRRMNIFICSYFRHDCLPMRRRLLLLWLKFQLVRLGLTMLDKSSGETSQVSWEIKNTKTVVVVKITTLPATGRCHISECMCDAASGWSLTSGQQAASWTSSALNFLPSTCCFSWFAFHISHLTLLTNRFSSQSALLSNFWWISLSPCRHR